jgi:ribonuclease HI
MWLKSYLEFGPNRPLWAQVADAIMAKLTPQRESRINITLKNNVFLQNWKTLNSKKSPKMIRKLIQTAKKYNVHLEGHSFETNISRNMPIWLHIKLDSRMIKYQSRTTTGKCLWKNHQIKLVGELADLAATLQQEEHVPDPNCQCETCTNAGDILQCENPHECYKKAEELLHLLPTKWNPNKMMEKDQQTNTDNNGPDSQQVLTFRPNFEVKGNPSAYSQREISLNTFDKLRKHTMTLKKSKSIFWQRCE